ncbi:PHP domain-containing protein [Clostridium septicum]|uniref:PHP domain-containing protein n=2 Tax=Clostridium septicum TaxID=1504 RepID=A0A9N7PLZ9_CLOSE|nr:PHP domain-containing protein [Clostridium septicum]AYE35251.1 PHP domain-containing protein [Clostridium septicum]MDU1313674.1 PHP domain-containing protein [Clostridium septicum]UEC20099.1 PHP domain-containing protein [Clostridium septicum]USS01845.1 PHP domain-containing protein [Clostridium septicum]WLF70417.1 PHP domain-containing protein [Clostridium septicum]
MYTKGDFHLHTTKSDGDHTPTEIVKMAKKQGLDIISITDHNTTAGIAEAKKIGTALGVKIIPGLELSTRYKGRKIHVLGYFLDDKYKNKNFQKGLKYIKSHNTQALQKLMKGKILVSKDDEKNRIDVRTGVDFLRFFGATIVLAHPVKIKPVMFREIINLDFNGIEAIYFKNKPEETEYFKKIAEDRDMFYTAGSDFHTNKTLDKRHGLIGDVYLNKEEIERFLKALEENN